MRPRSAERAGSSYRGEKGARNKRPHPFASGISAFGRCLAVMAGVGSPRKGSRSSSSRTSACGALMRLWPNPLRRGARREMPGFACPRQTSGRLHSLLHDGRSGGFPVSRAWRGSPFLPQRPGRSDRGQLPLRAIVPHRRAWTGSLTAPPRRRDSRFAVRNVTKLTALSRALCSYA